EDVALSAFASFCRAAAEARFPQLSDRDDLWQLLMVLTARKALDLRRHEGRQKRGGQVVFEEVLSETDSAPDEPGLACLVGREPSPAFAALMAEECERLLRRLPDAELRSLAVLKMEGYTNDEIAVQLGRAPRTIKRRLSLIRGLWSREVAP